MRKGRPPHDRGAGPSAWVAVQRPAAESRERRTHVEKSTPSRAAVAFHRASEDRGTLRFICWEGSLTSSPHGTDGASGASLHPFASRASAVTFRLARKIPAVDSRPAWGLPSSARATSGAGTSALQPVR